SGPGALAEPPPALQRLRRALLRPHLPAAVRLPRRLRGAAYLPAARLGADAAATAPAPPVQAAPVRRVLHRPEAPARDRGRAARPRGQPSACAARVTYTKPPRGPARAYDLDVNRPLSVDGAKVYLIGHGYAREFTVTDARGHVVYNQPTPFVAGASGNFLSEGVVKVPDAQPEQIGFTGVFVPTA